MGDSGGSTYPSLSSVHFSPRCFNRQGRNTRKKIPDRVDCEPAGGDVSLTASVFVYGTRSCTHVNTHTHIACPQ